jgi:hypothetical protein
VKTLRIIGGLFFSIGLLLLAIFIYSFMNTKALLENAMYIEGTVTEIIQKQSTKTFKDSQTGRTRTEVNTYYYPIVEYSMNGEQREFASNRGSNPSSYVVGEKVELIVSRDNPGKIHINSIADLWTVKIVLLFMGLVFTIIGGSLVVKTLSRKGKVFDVRANGVQIITKLVEISPNIDPESRMQIGYQVYSTWTNPGDGRVHQFVSENIKFDPTEKLDPEKIYVYLNPDNPEIYYMDLHESINVARKNKAKESANADDLDWSM